MFVKPTPKKLLALVLLVVCLLTSSFLLAGRFSAPETYQHSIETLDDKKITVVELTGATVLGSTALAAIPGDATTPIADQIARLSTYLMLVTGAIMLEKFLLTFTGLVAFRYMIPLACILAAVYLFLPMDVLKRLAAKLTIFSLAICLIVPVSVQVSTVFEETFHSHASVEEAIAELEEDVEEPEEAPQKPSFGTIIGQIGDQISGSLTKLQQVAKHKLSTAIDSVAVLVISNCAIPILVLFLFLWLTKAIFGLQVDLTPTKKILDKKPKLTLPTKPKE